MLKKWFKAQLRVLVKEMLASETVCKSLVKCDNCHQTLHLDFDAFEILAVDSQDLDSFTEYYCKEHKPPFDKRVYYPSGYNDFYRGTQKVTREGHAICDCWSCYEGKTRKTDKPNPGRHF